jgi:hypothetical protein
MQQNDDTAIATARAAAASDGLAYHDGVYYAAFHDATLVRRHLCAGAAADTTATARVWLRRGATVSGVVAHPTIGAVPGLFDRCGWCEQRFAPGAPAVTVAGRFLHEHACRQAFDRFIAEAELERAQAALRMMET